LELAILLPTAFSTTAEMASLNEKSGSLKPGGPQLTVNTTPVITEPEKCAHSDGSSTRTPTTYKKSEEIRRDSNLSTPRSYHGGNPFDTDIEAIIPTSSSQENCARNLSTTVTRSDCQVWPGKEHWKQKAKAAKMNNRQCTCMARLSKRTRIIVKVVIALLIVGIAVGVGFGVSKPLGAPIWGKASDQK
jgi:hypothetical protein